jgi:hypothetical protein
MADALEVNKSFFFHLKAGRRSFSDKTLWRLQKLEAEAGIASDQPPIAVTSAFPPDFPDRFILGELEELEDRAKEMIELISALAEDLGELKSRIAEGQKSKKSQS